MSSAGLEIRKNAIRIWIRRDGQTMIKETLKLKATPENIDHAKKLVDLIKLEMAMGTFDLARHFPDSKNISENSIKYYALLYKDLIAKEVAPSTYYGYNKQIDIHIIPTWGKVHPKDIDTNAIKAWIKTLKEKLNAKTIKEIVSRLAQIHALWRNEHKIAYNPFATITIPQNDYEEPDPFTLSEIKKILNTTVDESNSDIANLLPCIIWSGFSISEQIPIAWEDIDFKTGTIQIQRSYVRGVFRVTKNRRRKRRIQLLDPVLDALKRQYNRTAHLQPQTIAVLQRDNSTYKTEKLRFVWLDKETHNHFEYHILRYRWQKHLKKAGVRYRSPNQGRHTFASQLLSSGQVPPEWIAHQLGHTDTSMIYRHYGKLIADDMPDYMSKLNHYLKQ